MHKHACRGCTSPSPFLPPRICSCSCSCETNFLPTLTLISFHLMPARPGLKGHTVQTDRQYRRTNRQLHKKTPNSSGRGSSSSSSWKSGKCKQCERMQNAAFNTFERKRIQVADLTHSNKSPDHLAACTPLPPFLLSSSPIPSLPQVLLLLLPSTAKRALASATLWSYKMLTKCCCIA